MCTHTYMYQHKINIFVWIPILPVPLVVMSAFVRNATMSCKSTSFILHKRSSSMHDIWSFWFLFELILLTNGEKSLARGVSTRWLSLAKSSRHPPVLLILFHSLAPLSAKHSAMSAKYRTERDLSCMITDWQYAAALNSLSFLNTHAGSWEFEPYRCTSHAYARIGVKHYSKNHAAGSMHGRRLPASLYWRNPWLARFCLLLFGGIFSHLKGRLQEIIFQGWSSHVQFTSKTTNLVFWDGRWVSLQNPASRDHNNPSPLVMLGFATGLFPTLFPPFLSAIFKQRTKQSPPLYVHARHVQPCDLRVTQLNLAAASTLLRLVKTTLQIAKSARILPARKTNQDETAERAERA